MSARAALFDIDDTLYDSSRLTAMARRRAVEAMVEAGLTADPQEAENELARIVTDLGSNHEGHFDTLLCRLRVKNRHSQLIAAAVVAYHNTKLAYLSPFEETVPALLTLRQQGFRLGVITNGKPVKQWEKLIRLGLQHFFEVVTISDEVGFAKPDPRIYQLTCEQLGVRPEECFYVGNSLPTDIAGARAAQITAVHMQRGRHADEQPRSPAETPDFAITRLRDLIELLASGQLHGVPA